MQLFFRRLALSGRAILFPSASLIWRCRLAAVMLMPPCSSLKRSKVAVGPLRDYALAPRKVEVSFTSIIKAS